MFYFLNFLDGADPTIPLFKLSILRKLCFFLNLKFLFLNYHIQHQLFSDYHYRNKICCVFLKDLLFFCINFDF